MSLRQLPLPSVERHTNRQLFSDYYLNSILPGRSDWKQLALEAGAARAELKAIFARYTPSSNEAQTEEGLVKPVLRALGHTFEIQAPLATPGGTKKPDYIFYNDDAALVANKGRTLNESLLRGAAFAVGDAKYWERDLDKVVKSGTDPLTNHPSLQIAYYIQHSGVEWGMLTNGRLWRLYHKDSAHKLDHYYQVDLPALLEADDEESFLYFYAFFRREAFTPGPLGIAEILQASADYARGVGNTLKSQVYEALHHLAQGFLDYHPNQLTPDAATLRQIYDSSLIALYRLLFILYAEARELLPVRESQLYRDRYSLYAITHDIERDLRMGVHLLSGSPTLWPRLKTLFEIIDKGSPPLKVATFNGGLFDPQRHAFLDRYVVGDGHLQQAIDMLARVKGEFVDYRDLAERHLGTIYEGLLEFHLELEPGGDGRQVVLVNERGERHRTGSYYTPDYIVKWIVDQTVGPMLQNAVASASTDQDKLAAVLAVNVLDPSMGSGHFLVEATEYIARFLVQLNIQPAEQTGEADLAYWKRRVVQSCVYGVDLNPLAVELAKLSLWLITVAKDRPLSFLDHHLRCGNALVGARLSDLNAGKGDATAQKRAKKKLEQAEAAGQLALFGDDEFRRNMSSAVDSMWQIERTHGNTVDEVREQERLYHLLRETLTRKYGKLADLVTGIRFGITIDQALWQPLADYVTGKSIAAPPKFSTWLEQTETLARQHRFFHWELEFPEVFFDQQGSPLGERAGFDAIVGNPPYVRQEQLAPVKPYLSEAYVETFHGAADLFVYFYHQALRQLQQGGLTSYIVTNKWLRAGYGEPLRGYLAANARVHRLVDFGHAPIFEDADVFPCIMLLEKEGPAKPTGKHLLQASTALEEASQNGKEAEVAITLFPRDALGSGDIGSYIRSNSFSVSHRRFDARPWSLERSDVEALMDKIRQRGVPLSEFTRTTPFYGIKTGFNEAFLIDTPTKERLIREDQRSAEIIKPYLRGQDIKRWTPQWADLWMIFARRGIIIDNYPAVKQHLAQYRDRLEPRPKNWSGTAWSGRKPGSYQWYEIQDPVEYWALFASPKIIYQEIQFHPSYAFDDRGYFTNNKAFILPGANHYLIAVLNSPLMWWYTWRYLPHMKDEALNPMGELMVKLPIARPDDPTRTQAEVAVERLTILTQQQSEAMSATLDWLRTEFGVEAPGQKLEAFASLDENAFVEEVRKRRPKALGPLTPNSLKALRAGYVEQAKPLQQWQAEARQLERHLADLVNAAYGLTPEEIDLLWHTAPPRMPVGR